MDFDKGITTILDEKRLFFLLPVDRDEESMELAKAVKTIEEACVKYEYWLRENTPEPTASLLTRREYFRALNNIKRSRFELGHIDQDLCNVVGLRQEAAKAPRETTLQVVLPEEEA